MSGLTPLPWVYGVRKDGSIWLSLGDPKRGPHFQGDLVANEDDARLIVAAPDLLAALEILLAVADKRGKLGFDGFVEDKQQPVEIENARIAIAKARGKS